MEFLSSFHLLDYVWTGLFMSMAWSLYKLQKYAKADNEYVEQQMRANETF